MSTNTAIWREAFNLLCDKQVATGSARTVYNSELNQDWIIKIEDRAGSFQNVIEWQTWNRVNNTKWSRWFAPCYYISPCGAILIMARTTEPQLKDYPTMMPVYLSDLKYSNYGMFEGKLVCHDYGTNLLSEYGKTNKMRKADWGHE